MKAITWTPVRLFKRSEMAHYLTNEAINDTLYWLQTEGQRSAACGAGPRSWAGPAPRKGPRHWPGLRTWCTTPLEMPRAAAIRSWESLPTYLRRSIHPCCQAIEAVYTD